MAKFHASECRAVAEQALRLAAGAHTPEAKHTYVRLAALWHGLADHLTARESRAGQPDGAAPIGNPEDDRVNGHD
jgi:hypothetical protein